MTPRQGLSEAQRVGRAPLELNSSAAIAGVGKLRRTLRSWSSVGGRDTMRDDMEVRERLAELVRLNVAAERPRARTVPDDAGFLL